MTMMVLKCNFFGVQTHNKTNIITTQKKQHNTKTTKQTIIIHNKTMVPLNSNMRYTKF